jgi:tripartite-type tricarboxylate transporter receptor subunit TctC
LIALAKDRPGRLNYGSDTGNAAHLSAELLSYMTGVKLVHIPYKGQAPAMIDTLAGQIPFMFDPVITSLQYVKAGRLKALASTGARRSPQAPEVPTMAESGLPGFEVTAWYGLVAPAKTPRDIVAQIGKATGEVLRAGEVRDRLVATGTEVVGGTPDEFDAHIRREIAKWEKVLKAARIAGTF